LVEIVGYSASGEAEIFIEISNGVFLHPQRLDNLPLKAPDWSGSVTRTLSTVRFIHWLGGAFDHLESLFFKTQPAYLLTLLAPTSY
jgi:hypothetical protein